MKQWVSKEASKIHEMQNDRQKQEFVRYALLIVTALAQAMTLLMTWVSWQVRTSPPHLPVFDLPQIPFGVALLVSLAAIPFLPRVGVWAHFVLLVISCLFDQYRMQPQILATWILMLGLVHDWGREFTRWFLVSLWLWAGIHKLISDEWFAQWGWRVADTIGLDADSVFYWVALAVACSELTVGVVAWFKPRWGAIASVGLHVGIAIYVSPILLDWNYSVIPWNLATAVVGGYILWNADGVLPKGMFHCGSFVCLMIAPAGFYWGVFDHGYSHVLYSGGLPQGAITRADGSFEAIDGWGETAFPFPKERRLIRQYFAETSRAGDKMHLYDPRTKLEDQFFVMSEQGPEPISKTKFLENGEGVMAGHTVDSQSSIFWLKQANVRLLQKKGMSPVYAADFSNANVTSTLLRYLLNLQNLEQVQFRGTTIEDADLEFLLHLTKLNAIGLDKTRVTDAGIRELQKLSRLETIEYLGTEISENAIEQFMDSRNE